MDYPSDRRGVFALDLIKILHRSEAVRRIDTRGLALVTHVAVTEHALDYLAPPDFWVSQLMVVCCVADDETFRKIRTICVNEGWLVYISGGTRGIGRYWTMIPKPISDRLLLHRSNRPNGRAIAGQSPGNDQVIAGQSSGNRRPLPPPSSRIPTPTPIPDGCVWVHDAASMQTFEAALVDLTLASGPKATPRWIAALRRNRSITTLADAVRCLTAAVDAANRDGRSVSFASDVRPIIAAWRPATAPATAKKAPKTAPVESAADRARAVAKLRAMQERLKAKP